MDLFFLLFGAGMLGMALGMWIQREIFLLELQDDLKRALDELHNRNES
jgi:hypothetical protein